MAGRESSWSPARAFIEALLWHLRHKGFPQVMHGVPQCSCPWGGSRKLTCSICSICRNWAGNGEYQPQMETWHTNQGHSLCGIVTKAGLKIVKASLKSVLQDLAARLLVPQQRFPSYQTTPAMQKATAVCFSTSHMPCRLPIGTLTRRDPAYFRRQGTIISVGRLETSNGLKDEGSRQKWVSHPLH